MTRSTAAARPRWGIPLALPHAILSAALLAFACLTDTAPEPAPPPAEILRDSLAFAQPVAATAFAQAGSRR